MRGFGRICRRGAIYWIAYSHRGRERRESSQSSSERIARSLLKKRLGEIGGGKIIGPIEEKVFFGDMAEDLLTDYKVNGYRSVETLHFHLKHLRTAFGFERALDITTDRIRRYTLDRQREGASTGSINRELAALRRMFNLALQAGKLRTTPHIPMLEENGTRQGFVDHGGFLALRSGLPAYLKDPVTFLYLSGWRVSEMRTLQWRGVDLEGKVVRLRLEVSKNKESRVLPLRDELLEIVERAHDSRRADCPFVFHSEGVSIGDFRKSWKPACRKAGLAGTIVHDLRRTV